MLTLSDKQIRITNFHFYVSYCSCKRKLFFSAENTINIAFEKNISYDLVIPMVFHKDQCGILLKVIIRTVLIQFYGVVK